LFSNQSLAHRILEVSPAKIWGHSMYLL
jgi:hypothetical protein